MRAQRQPKEFNGEPVRRPARSAAPIVLPDGLYRYQPMPPATVCADLFLHYRKGDKKAVLAPDLFVALRVPPIEDRTSYKLWEDPVPDMVIEMLSGSTADKDACSKRDTYRHFGVREYWLFDPAGHELSASLAGYRLRAKRYRPIDPDAAGRRRSKVLGLDLHVRDGELRFRDPVTSEDLRTYAEAEARGHAEKCRADAAEAGLAAAERELARLRSRLGGLGE